jgi:hypothetical protein
MKKVAIFLLLFITMTNTHAQSDIWNIWTCSNGYEKQFFFVPKQIMDKPGNEKWYYGLYRNESGKELIIQEHYIILLSDNPNYRTYSEFDNIVLGEQYSGDQRMLVLWMADEEDYDAGVIVLQTDSNELSLRDDFHGTSFNPDGSLTLNPMPELELKYSKIDGLSSRTFEKVSAALDKTSGYLNEGYKQLVQFISDNDWLYGIWVSDSGKSSFVVLHDAMVIQSYEGHEEFLSYEGIIPDDGAGDTFYVNCRSEEGISINIRTKKIHSDFYGNLKKIWPLLEAQ